MVLGSIEYLYGKKMYLEPSYHTQKWARALDVKDKIIKLSKGNLYEL